MNHLKNPIWQYALLLLPLLILIYLSYLSRGFQLDDALIYQRYIQNWLAGEGLVYNKGEFYNALTSPLFTYLAMFFSWLFGNIQLGVIILSATLMGATLVVLTLLFARYIQPFFAVLGAAFIVACPFFYYVYGMETALFVFLLSLSLYLFDKHDYHGLGISLALLLVTRSEGIFLLLAMFIEHVRLRRPFPPLHYFIIPTCIIVTVFGFNKLYYGHFLAETGKVKIYQGMSGLWGEWPTAFFRGFHHQITWYFHNSVTLFGITIIVSLLGCLAFGWRSLNIVIVLFLLFYTAFYVLLNIPSYHWYFSPYYLFIFFYIAVAIAWLYQNIRTITNSKVKLFGYTFLAVIILQFSINSMLQTKANPLFGDVQHHAYRDVGLWIKHNTAPEAKIALIEIGHVGYYSERYLIDILGLVNPFNAHFISERQFSHWLLHYEPDYILTHVEPWLSETGAETAALLGDFVTTDMQIAGFQLLRKQSIDITVLPKQINGFKQLRKADGQYMLIVHAPGEVVFNLPAGRYRINGEFGLHPGAYTNNLQPTDGVTFEVAYNQQKLLLHNLTPLLKATDRGIKTFTVITPTAPTTEINTLVLRTLPNAHSQSDWSFWRNVRIKAMP